MNRKPHSFVITASILIVSICLGCASQDYDNYLRSKVALSQVAPRPLAEVNGIIIYDQRSPELAPPQTPWWVPLLTTAITMTGQVVLGVSGNNTQADIVRALAAGIGSSYSSYSANVTNTTTGSNNSAGRDLISGTKADARFDYRSDSSVTDSYNRELSVYANRYTIGSNNDSSTHPTTTTTSTTSTDNSVSRENTENPTTTTTYPISTQGTQ